MNGGLREISLSLRYAAMDGGGRTESGTEVENEVRNPSREGQGEGNKIFEKQDIVCSPSLILSFSRREKVPSFELVGRQ
jgi:hypothetical protein